MCRTNSECVGLWEVGKEITQRYTAVKPTPVGQTFGLQHLPPYLHDYHSLIRGTPKTGRTWAGVGRVSVWRPCTDRAKRCRLSAV